MEIQKLLPSFLPSRTPLQFQGSLRLFSNVTVYPKRKQKMYAIIIQERVSEREEASSNKHKRELQDGQRTSGAPNTKSLAKQSPSDKTTKNNIHICFHIRTRSQSPIPPSRRWKNRRGVGGKVKEGEGKKTHVLLIRYLHQSIFPVSNISSLLLLLLLFLLPGILHFFPCKALKIMLCAPRVSSIGGG